MSINLPVPLAVTLRVKLFLLTAALVLLTAIGWSQEYTVTNLGTLGGATSQAYAINNLGHVTGLSLNSKGIWFPFLYSNGTTNAIATDIYIRFLVRRRRFFLTNLLHFSPVLMAQSQSMTTIMSP